MADYVKRIRTEAGDLQIDYESLANLPVSDATLTQTGKFADAKAVGDKISELSSNISDTILQTITPESIGALPDTYTPPVTSVNGQTGAVTVNVPVTSVNGQTGAVTVNVPVTSVDGKTGDVTTGAYTASNPPPYPVTSVNGSTGDVTVNVPVKSMSLSGTTLYITLS